ncbi:MAG: tetratricopeptide repeat protein [Planctomycetaceae bacterium]|nr:tetratricopeptide repeat protein [Planctomycetaceae bacterium]
MITCKKKHYVFVFFILTSLWVLSECAVFSAVPQNQNDKQAAPKRAGEAAPAAVPATESHVDNAAANDVEKSKKDESAEKIPPEIEPAVKLFLVGDFDGAKLAFDEAYKKNPKLSPPGIFMAQFFSNLQQPVEVRHWLDVTTSEQPDDPEAYLQLADIALFENRLTEAQLLAEKGVSLLGNVADNEERGKPLHQLADTTLAALFQARGDWENAKKHLEQLLVLSPNDPEVLTRLGFVAVQQGKLDEAVNWYTQAVKAGAALPTPKLIIAQLLDQQGKSEEAKKYFNDAMQTPNLDGTSLRLAVAIALRWNDLAGAEKYLQKAMQAEPNHFENVLYAGTVALFKREFLEAEKHFQNAVLMQPNHQSANNGLAIALAEQPEKMKLERALMYAKNNVQYSQQSPDSIATLAWVFHRMGKTVEAEGLLDRVLASGSISPLNAYFLAEIVAARGQKEKAISLLNVALKYNIGFMKKQEAEELLKKLKSAPIDSTPDNPPPKNLKDSSASKEQLKEQSKEQPASTAEGEPKTEVKLQSAPSGETGGKAPVRIPATRPGNGPVRDR